MRAGSRSSWPSDLIGFPGSPAPGRTSPGRPAAAEDVQARWAASACEVRAKHNSKWTGGISGGASTTCGMSWKVRQHRQRYRQRRRLAAVATVSMVGYTNAGKSTLLGRLSGADVVVADQLFATLDPMTRRISLPSGRGALLTDTVGFIQKLPAMLVAAFRATLEEVAEADLLLHVVDISHPQAVAQARAVRATLEEGGAASIPVVTALNKVDRFGDPLEAEAWIDEFDRAVTVSAVTGAGLPALLAAIEHELYQGMVPVDVGLPYQAGRLLSLMHEHGRVERTEHTGSMIHVVGRVPRHLAAEFDPYRRPRRRSRSG